MAEELGRLLATSIAQLEQRLSAQIGGGFEHVGRKVGQLERKMDNMEERMKTMEGKMGQMKYMIKEVIEQQGVEKKETSGDSSDEETSVWSDDDEEETSGSEGSGRVRRPRRIRPWDNERGWSSAEFSRSEEDDTRTAKEPGVLRKEYHDISWKVADEIIKKMQAERMSKGEEIPSMWNYDARCLPKEFVGLAKKTFLVDPPAVNICFLGKDILRKIGKMLIPMDFLNLSYTCRYLHWRLFTFCTCYAPYRVWMRIRDTTVGYYEKMCDEAEWHLYETAPNKIVYSLSLEEKYRQSILAKEEGLRAIVARIPSCLRKPFLFDHLSMYLHLPFFTKYDFDRCLVFIQPLRKYARELKINMYYYNRGRTEKFFEYQAANAFLQGLNAASYYACNWKSYCSNFDRTVKVYENCPYARLIDRIDLDFRYSGSKFNDVFLNRVGNYRDPPVSAIIRTIKEFCYGSANLDYHEYELQDIGKQLAFLEYFFANYLDYEEYYHEYFVQMWVARTQRRVKQSKIVRFVTVMTEETGRKHIMRVSIEPFYDCLWTYVAFGTEQGFAAERKKSFQNILKHVGLAKIGGEWRRPWNRRKEPRRRRRPGAISFRKLPICPVK